MLETIRQSDTPTTPITLRKPKSFSKPKSQRLCPQDAAASTSNLTFGDKDLDQFQAEKQLGLGVFDFCRWQTANSRYPIGIIDMGWVFHGRKLVIDAEMRSNDSWKVINSMFLNLQTIFVCLCLIQRFGTIFEET